MNFLKNFGNILRLHERVCIFVLAEKVIAQTPFQLRHRGEDATTNLLLREHGEEPLREIGSGRAGRDEVREDALLAFNPCEHLLLFVRPVVVQSRLEGLGLLRHVHTTLELTLSLLRPPTHDRDTTLIHGNHVALIVIRGEIRRPLDKEPVRLPVLQVTRPGYEIVSMLRPHTDVDYLKDIARRLMDQGFSITMTGFRTSPLTYSWALHFPGPYQTLEPDRR